MSYAKGTDGGSGGAQTNAKYVEEKLSDKEKEERKKIVKAQKAAYNAVRKSGKKVSDFDPYGNDAEFKKHTNGVGGGSSYIPGVLTSGSINGIFGMPYQFLPSVDRRVYVEGNTNDNTIMGRKYAEKVASHLPLLFLTPCRQVFMEGFDASDQESVLGSIVNGAGIAGAIGGNGVVESSLLKKTGRYYSAKYAWAEYYRCVNKLATQVAVLCGLQDELSSDGTNLASEDWVNKKFHNESFDRYFAAKKSVVLYVDGLTTVDDSFSNSTTDSSLASTINGFGEQARELRFITGGSSGLSAIYDKGSEMAQDITKDLTSITERFGGASLTEGMLGDLAKTGVSTVLTGGKIIFPKIWGDSSYSRSYSFSIKLRSPDHDSYSIYRNILIPYLHLLALVMPQSLTSGPGAQNPNAYDTPFLVRAYAKGMFNINMGMITSMDVTRGAEAQWNDQGLPTQMDINITIEDLYTSLYLSNPKGINYFRNTFDIITNTEMVDYLANLSGLNVAAETVTRQVQLFKYMVAADFARTPSNIYNYFENGVTNLIRRAFERLF